MIVVVAVELYLRGEAAPAALSALSASLILLLAVTIGTVLLLTGPLVQGQFPAAAVVNKADEALHARLQTAIATERILRQEGLTIARLAAQLDVPEYRLRRVINRTLGFRNFNDFLNHYRIRDARIALEDPTRAGVSVLTVALEMGYQSLSPFNRAFKAQTGSTPSAYRRAKRSGEEPNLTDS
jgi:AraC-like DNA-binding protein